MNTFLSQTRCDRGPRRSWLHIVRSIVVGTAVIAAVVTSSGAALAAESTVLQTASGTTTSKAAYAPLVVGTRTATLRPASEVYCFGSYCQYDLSQSDVNAVIAGGGAALGAIVGARGGVVGMAVAAAIATAIASKFQNSIPANCVLRITTQPVGGLTSTVTKYDLKTICSLPPGPNWV